MIEALKAIFVHSIAQKEHTYNWHVKDITYSTGKCNKWKIWFHISNWLCPQFPEVMTNMYNVLTTLTILYTMDMYMPYAENIQTCETIVWVILHIRSVNTNKICAKHPFTQQKASSIAKHRKYCPPKMRRDTVGLHFNNIMSEKKLWQGNSLLNHRLFLIAMSQHASFWECKISTDPLDCFTPGSSSVWCSSLVRRICNDCCRSMPHVSHWS